MNYPIPVLSLPTPPRHRVARTAIAAVILSSMSLHSAKADVLEEVVVTARKVQESMQDVPVTVTAISGGAMDRFAMDDPIQIANFVPNMTIQKGGSGSGGSVRLRGIGSSSISGAFDSAISFNIDGVQSNNARMLFLSMYDLSQVEVLKGPQSLYFGKSSTAGVITLTSENPGDEFEAGVKASHEFENDGQRVEAFLSGPITDQLGARLAVKWNEVDEIMENTSVENTVGGSPTGLPPYLFPSEGRPANSWRGEESRDARLTLDWQPTDDFHANFKLAYSEYENDGESFMIDVFCTNAEARPDNILQGAFVTPATLDCDETDHEIQANDYTGIIGENRKQVPFSDNEVVLTSLTMDWQISENWSLTSVTGYIDLDNDALENTGFTNNTGPGTLSAKVERENFSQELRFYSNYGGAFDVNGGLYYQSRDNVFDTEQLLVGVALLVGPDPVSGNTADEHKIHDTEIDAYSAYVNLTWRPTDNLEINAGGRYSDEEHTGSISVPYVHPTLVAGGFLPAGSRIDNIEFEDDDFNPEVSVLWSVTDDINLFASYKTGFKSGGIDNSVLPTAGLSEETVEDIVVFDSETVEGFEAGIKSYLLDRSLRLNATAFFYTFEDLQTQEFDVNAFNFITLNAGEVETWGAEVEALWSPITNLTLTGALAYTDSEYTDDFFVTGETNLDPETGLENLDGTQPQGNSKWAGNIGVDYVFDLFNDVEMTVGALANYRDGYQAGVFTNSYHQDSFWKVDASVSIGSTDGRWELALIGRNINDEVTVNTAIANRPQGLPDPETGFNDQLVQISHGREVLLQAKYNF